MDLDKKREHQPSRRLANAKRSAFQAKLNRIFILVLLLIGALLYAMFNL